MKCKDLDLYSKKEQKLVEGLSKVTLFRLCFPMISLTVVLRIDCRGKGKSREINEEATVTIQGREVGLLYIYITSLRLEGPVRQILQSPLYTCHCALSWWTSSTYLLILKDRKNIRSSLNKTGPTKGFF